jgi:hypothetical protein
VTAVELLLLELVQIAEAPLYSSYRWLDHRLAGRLSLRSFLALVEGLVVRDVVRLWSVDARTGDRTELYSVPEALGARYSRITDLDESFDPFGLSLTLGPAAPEGMTAEPAWSLELDAINGTFELRAPEHTAEAVLHDVEDVLHEVRLRPSELRLVGDGQVIIAGHVESRSDESR